MAVIMRVFRFMSIWGDCENVVSEQVSCEESCISDGVYVEWKEELPCVDEKLETSNEEKSSWWHEIAEEIKELTDITAPGIAVGLLCYARNLISMLFLGRLGQLELAAGSLSVGFANITGYSVIFGLATGMEPICGQAYGAKNYTLLAQTLHRTITILLLTCLPISLVWLNADKILIYLGQDPTISRVAATYLRHAIPDLIALSFLHPLRSFLRAQNVNHIHAVSSAIASLIHVPLNYYFVLCIGGGVGGVAIATAATDFVVLLLLWFYIRLSGACKQSWRTVTGDCFNEWSSFLSLAIPSCVSVCLEWWWYEIMIMLCGLLSNPKETVSAIGVLMQMAGLVYVFPSSLSYGVSTRVAQELGASKPEAAKRAAYVGTICGAITGILALVFDLWATKWWGAMFSASGRVLELVAAALPVLGLCELGNCPQTAMCGAMRGSARANVGARVNLAGFYGVGLPVALFLAFRVKSGFVGLWVGLLAAQAACTVVLGVVMMATDWEVQAKRAKELTSLEGDGEEESLKGVLVQV